MRPEIPEDLIAKIQDIARTKERVIVAIAGPPGAGKSTITDSLVSALEDAAVLPMDGFHLDNSVLTERGLLNRKGAPETFDTDGLLSLLTAVRRGDAVRVPTFDREADSVIPDGDAIPAEARIVLVEGNYLLLDAPGWRDLAQFWDLTIALRVPRDVLEQRLMQRWLDHGYAEEAAKRKVYENDMLNADTVFNASRAADVVVQQ